MQEKADSFKVVVVGASAGGVEALSELVRVLPADLDAAVFVVLHVPAHSDSQLHKVLQTSTGLRVMRAQDGAPIEAGTVYVASADRHLVVQPDIVRITRGPKECRVRPAIDVLFRSAAVAYGPRVVGVVLTGTLDDGTAGLWSVVDQGGVALVQDPAEAQYDSMPLSAIEHVAVDLVAPIHGLGRHIVELCSRPAPPAGGEGHRERYRIENRIADTGNGLSAGVMNLGKVSKYTCPDCHGVLVQIEEGSVVRFRCHTGHAFSLKSLIAEVNDAVDSGLWDTLRAVEERVMLMRQVAELAAAAGDTAEATRCTAQADEAEAKLQPLRALVLDSEFFGHSPQG